jgi:nitrogen fixation NifU-like protein
MSDIKSNNGDWVYSDTVKEHFFRPKNILEDESKFAADGVGYVGSPACGDMMKVWLKVDRQTDKITDFKWRTFGCASAIGSTSMLSEMVTENGGMMIEAALKLKPQDIMTRLGGLPDNKIHCSVLGDKALLSAVNDYFAKSGQKERIIRSEAKVICECLNVTDHEIEDAVLEGKHDFEAVQKVTKAGTGCGRCVPKVKELIEAYKSKYFGDE